MLFGILHHHFMLLEEPKISLEFRKHRTIIRISNSFDYIKLREACFKCKTHRNVQRNHIAPLTKIDLNLGLVQKSPLIYPRRCIGLILLF